MAVLGGAKPYTVTDAIQDQKREEARRAIDPLNAPIGLERFRSAVPVPRELLLDAGAIEPTAAERAEYERQRAESERRRAEQEAKLAAARAELAAITDPLARTVLDLHCEDGHGDCGGCDFSGWEAEPPRWPCTTTITIARRYGIDLGDQP